MSHFGDHKRVSVTTRSVSTVMGEQGEIQLSSIEWRMLKSCSNIQKSLIHSKQHSYVTVKLAEQSTQHPGPVTEYFPVVGPQHKASIFLGNLVY